MTKKINFWLLDAIQAASTLGVCFSALFTFCICQVGPSIRRPEPSGKLEHTTRQKNPQNFWHARGTPTTAPIFPKILGLIMAGQFGQNVNKAEKPSPLYARWSKRWMLPEIITPNYDEKCLICSEIATSDIEIWGDRKSYLICDTNFLKHFRFLL